MIVNTTNDNNMINEDVSPKGKVTIIVRNNSGDITQQIESTNMVVTAGKNWIAQRFTASGVAANAQMTHMGIGTGNVDPALTDTNITQVGTKVTFTPAEAEVSGGVVTYTATFPANNPATQQTITEAGIFNSGTINVGTMLCRTKFAAVTKAAADSMTIIWAITVA